MAAPKGESKTPKFTPIFSLYGTEGFYETLKLADNEKQKEKFIKSVERIIRTSQEYSQYIRYLKTTAMLTQCSVLNKLPEEVSKALTIEMHHCPLTLYDLVDIILTRQLSIGGDFTRISIANDVMVAHYMNQVGLVPMTKTMHQMIHENVNVVNHRDIFGNFDAFAETYSVFLTEEHQNKIARVKRTPDEVIMNTRRKYMEVNPELYTAIDHTNFTQIEVIVDDSPDDAEMPSVEEIFKNSEKKSATAEKRNRNKQKKVTTTEVIEDVE